ncbi:MAG: hypothetical protein R2769_00415 [Saprospiraceae bacterium]
MDAKGRKHIISLEVVWWLITAVITFGVLFPIWQKVPDYPFWLTNSIFIVVFITYARLIFFTNYSFLGENKVLKFIFIAISVPVIFLLIHHLNKFQTFLDEQGPVAIVGNMSIEDEASIMGYIHKEMLFFATASIITAILLPFKMVVSIWKTYNKDRF